MTDKSLRERLMRVGLSGAEATLAVACVEAWLADNGLAIVPVMVSVKMNHAACRARWRGNPKKPAWVFLADARVDASLFWDMWGAAIKAAPPAAELLKGKSDDQG